MQIAESAQFKQVAHLDSKGYFHLKATSYNVYRTKTFLYTNLLFGIPSKNIGNTLWPFPPPSTTYSETGTWRFRN